MNVSVNWQTRYTYESAVRMVHTEVRVLPDDRWGQQVASRSLATEPETPVGVSSDALGNEVHRLGFLGGVSQITITAQAHVITPDGHQAWHEDLSPLHRYLALQPTSRSPFASEVSALADDAGDSGDALAYALGLM